MRNHLGRHSGILGRPRDARADVAVDDYDNNDHDAGHVADDALIDGSAVRHDAAARCDAFPFDERDDNCTGGLAIDDVFAR